MPGLLFRLLPIGCLVAISLASIAATPAIGTRLRLPATQQHTQTIVAVGDSITYGDWDTQTPGGWVTRLQSKLSATYPSTHFVIRNAGVDGDTTQGVLQRLQRDVLSANPNLVIVSIGTNDFDYGVPRSTFESRLTTLVQRLQAAPGHPVVILASMLPIAGQTPQRLSAERAYNDVIRATAARQKVGYLDLFDQWLALGPAYLHSLRHDSEHPNPIGYELLASTTAAFLEAGYLTQSGQVTVPPVIPTCHVAVCGSVSHT